MPVLRRPVEPAALFGHGAAVAACPPGSTASQALRLDRSALRSISRRSKETEEKHEPASDIETALMDSLKALDPEGPIREADIVRRARHVGKVP